MPQRLHALSKTVSLTAAILACAAVSAAQAAHPDFTGVWETHREPGQQRASGFGNLRANLPLTAEGKRRVAEYRKLSGPQRDNPAAYCAEYGMPTLMQLPGFYPLEFIQKPDQLTLIYEIDNETRHIYIGDRQLPKDKRLPSRDGYSEGHWDGNVLVVETTALTDGIDQSMHPHSDKATIEERFSMRKTDDGTKLIHYEATMTDPVYYTKPIKIEHEYEPRPNAFMIPYYCPNELWDALLDMRRKQMKAGKPIDAQMSDVYKAREANE